MLPGTCSLTQRLKAFTLGTWQPSSLSTGEPAHSRVSSRARAAHAVHALWSSCGRYQGQKQGRFVIRSVFGGCAAARACVRTTAERGGWGVGGGGAAHYDHGIPHLSATPHGKGATRRSSSVVARTRRSTSGTVIMPRCLRCALIAVLPLHERMVMAHGSISRIGLRDGSIASAGACGSFGHRQRRCVEPVRPLYDGIC